MSGPGPYTPRTNGKAERFIQASLKEWARKNAYESSAEREVYLNPWLDHICISGGLVDIYPLHALNSWPIPCTKKFKGCP